MLFEVVIFFVIVVLLFQQISGFRYYENFSFVPAWNLFEFDMSNEQDRNNTISHAEQSITPNATQKSKATSVTVQSNNIRGGYKLHSIDNLILAHLQRSATSLPSIPMQLRCDLFLVKIKCTVEKDGLFESVVALFMRWNDTRLHWDPAKYGNVTSVTFAPGEVWTPDIAMVNSAGNQYELSRDAQFSVRYSHNGLVTYVPQGPIRTWCKLELLLFPFDYQMCSYELESWSYNASVFQFSREAVAYISSTTGGGGQWLLCDRRVIVDDHTYENVAQGVETFSRLRFIVSIKRRPGYYIMNLLFPCFIASLIQLLTFAIPSKNAISSRLAFGIVNVLTLFFFQAMLTEEMPKSSDAVTPLSDYISTLICLATANVFEITLAERVLLKSKIPPPRKLVQAVRLVPMLWQPPSAVDNGNPVVDTSLPKPSRWYNYNRHSVLTQPPLASSGSFRFRRKSLDACFGNLANVQLSPIPILRFRFMKQDVGESPPDEPIKRKSTYGSKRMKDTNTNRMNNSLLWEEVVTRIDSLFFLLWFSFVLAAPAFLFVPPLVRNYPCPLQEQDFAGEL